MEITTTTRHEIKWDFPESSTFQATLINGKITALNFPDVGELTESELCSANEKYLRNTYKALHGLFQHLDSIRKVGRLAEDAEEPDEKIKALQYHLAEMHVHDAKEDPVASYHMK